MTPAEQARNLAISLEAKKDALSQRQSGDWKISFTVQGIDMDARLTQAPMGTRYAMVLVEIGDDETPVNRKEAMPDIPDQTLGRHTARPRPENDKPQAGAKRDWREVQPSAQAAMRCDQAPFWAFLREEHNQRVTSKDDAATAVRKICGVNSRAHFNDNHVARVAWHQLDGQFQAWLARERVGA